MERLTGTEREQFLELLDPDGDGEESRCTTFARSSSTIRRVVAPSEVTSRRRPDARAVHAARAGLPRYCGDRRLVPLRGSSEEVASEGGGLGATKSTADLCPARARARRVDQVAVACRPGVYEWVGVGRGEREDVRRRRCAADACRVHRARATRARAGRRRRRAVALARAGAAARTRRAVCGSGCDLSHPMPSAVSRRVRPGKSYLREMNGENAPVGRSASQALEYEDGLSVVESSAGCARRSDVNASVSRPTAPHSPRERRPRDCAEREAAAYLRAPSPSPTPGCRAPAAGGAARSPSATASNATARAKCGAMREPTPRTRRRAPVRLRSGTAGDSARRRPCRRSPAKRSGGGGITCPGWRGRHPRRRRQLRACGWCACGHWCSPHDECDGEQSQWHGRHTTS